MKNFTPPDQRRRCAWCTNSELELRYHDEEWGVPVHEDQTWFEFLILEGAQAGLSWHTILVKRERYRQVLADFDPEVVARFSKRDQNRLLKDPGIVRNRLKIESTVSNAQQFLTVQREFGSFNEYIWNFMGGKPLINKWRSNDQVPAQTAESDAMSKALKKRGFKFVGSTICYAFMQATGLVNDHVTACYRHKQIAKNSVQE